MKGKSKVKSVGEQRAKRKHRLPNPMSKKGRPERILVFLPMYIRKTLAHRCNRKYIQPYFMTRSGFVFRDGVHVYSRSSDNSWYNVPHKNAVLPPDHDDVIWMEALYQRYFKKKGAKHG